MTDLLRDAIRQSGKSLSQLGEDSGISAGQLSRFVRGERDLRGSAIDKLCQALRLTLVRVIGSDRGEEE